MKIDTANGAVGRIGGLTTESQVSDQGRVRSDDVTICRSVDKLSGQLALLEATLCDGYASGNN